MKNLILFASVLFLFSTTSARQIRKVHPHYYGNLRKAFHLISPEKLKGTLTAILSNAHIYNPGKPDTILKTGQCSQGTKNCYHHVLAEFKGAQPTSRGSEVRDAYRKARHVLYQAITPVKVAPGTFHFNPIYFTEPLVVKGSDNFRFFEYVNKNGINCEHVWPQSKFGNGNKNSYGNRFKKTDLHHIYPANAKMNSHRGSFPFAEIRTNNTNPEYGNAVGIPLKMPSRSRGQAFMPIPSSRGRVARAMMYFSTRYNKPISPLQEYYIRKWHREYPVTKEEVRRNNRVFKYQRNRNPFVDYPKLESHIADF